ncbi:hypothetical protein EK904_009834 [Melospiza melodia maxima]|nr:hypothetical protein EK904_009834 [Melospiza melodia maxima]
MQIPEPWAAAEPFSEPPKAIPGVLVVVKDVHRVHPAACDCSGGSKSRVLLLEVLFLITDLGAAPE